ncbi:MAG: SGNH/GDSL hydrolase family protein [Hyphomicrobiales bacterium]|nr:SGNH/GDSL hydrolase family protein [Hyphomicrobiales bacterium]MBV8825944.1 SGNH/GDSL hydrolase family protein [Hyphomicrobiales bacterium]MBV9426929.1 SGNH/GDSL hydrolase family protein [Bradyrhizobiaceae bacterium]
MNFSSAVSRSVSATLLLALSTVIAPAAERPGKPQCTVSAAALSSGHWFARTAARLEQGKPVTIVAIGSSSTFGVGASSSAAAYPARLEALLKQRFPDASIKVLNRGINGEDAPEMLARLSRDVIEQKPDLVLWQVGTNAVLHNPGIAGQGSLIRQGIERLKATGADVVLIDPQYAPAVIARPQARRMVELIRAEANEEGAGLLRRFALMRSWYEVRHLAFGDFVSPDGLHMNDWGYDCIARQLAGAIDSAVGKPATTAAAVVTH